MKKLRKLFCCIMMLCLAFALGSICVEARTVSERDKEDARLVRYMYNTKDVKFYAAVKGTSVDFCKDPTDLGYSNLQLLTKGTGVVTYKAFTRPYKFKVYFFRPTETGLIQLRGYRDGAWENIVLYCYDRSELVDNTTVDKTKVAKGNSIKLEYDFPVYCNVELTSSNPSVVSVSGMRLIGKKAGSAKINMEYQFNGIKCLSTSWTVKCTAPVVNSIYVKNSGLSINCGMAYTVDKFLHSDNLKVYAKYSDGTSKQVDPDNVTVYYKGGIPEKAGTYTLVVKACGKITTTSVKVTNDVAITKIAIHGLILTGKTWGRKLYLRNINATYTYADGRSVKFKGMPRYDEDKCVVTYKYGTTKAGKKYCDVTVTYKYLGKKVVGKKRVYAPATV